MNSSSSEVKPRLATLARLRAVYGIPSGLVLAGVLFVQAVFAVAFAYIDTPLEQLVTLLVLGGLCLVFFARWDRTHSTAANVVIGVDGASKLARRKGLVIVIGLDSGAPNSSVAKLLAAAHGVEWIALLGTPETEAAGVAKAIRERLMTVAGIDLPASRVRTWEDDNNAESLADFERSTLEAVNWMTRNDVEIPEIVVDVTAGRRPMGLGAQDAAKDLGVEVQYLSYRWNKATNSPKLDEPMFKVVREHYAPESAARPVRARTIPRPAPVGAQPASDSRQ